MKMDVDENTQSYSDLLSDPTSEEFPKFIRIPESINQVQCDFGKKTDLSIIRKNNTFSQQYAKTYYIRLMSLREPIEYEIKKKWKGIPIKKISELCDSKPLTTLISSPKKVHHSSPRKYVPSPKKLNHKDELMNDTENDQIAVIGTIFKQQPEKPSILQELVEEIQLTDHSVKHNYISDKDVILLEDETTRVRIITTKDCGFTVNGLVNGLVAGVKGKPTVDGKLEVYDVIWPTPKPCIWPNPKSSIASEIVLISGLDFGRETENSIPMGLLFENLLGLVGSGFEQNNVIRKRTRVFFIGNSLHQGCGTDAFKTTAENARNLDRMLSTLAQTMEVFVVSGKEDPVDAMYPQPPLHHCLFPHSKQFSTFNLLSNPSFVHLKLNPTDQEHSRVTEEAGIDLILTSGETIEDAKRFSDVKTSEEMAQNMLQWGHLCPTAPDTLPLHPGAEDDAFIIKDRLPNYFCIGNQKDFKHLEWNSTKIVCVPKFSDSGSIVLITENFDFCTLNFNISL